MHGTERRRSVKPARLGGDTAFRPRYMRRGSDTAISRSSIEEKPNLHAPADGPCAPARSSLRAELGQIRASLDVQMLAADRPRGTTLATMRGDLRRCASQRGSALGGSGVRAHEKVAGECREWLLAALRNIVVRGGSMAELDARAGKWAALRG